MPVNEDERKPEKYASERVALIRVSIPFNGSIRPANMIFLSPQGGLAGHLALVADDGEAQSSPGAGADQGLLGLARQPGTQGVDAVEDVGPDRRRGGAAVQDLALGRDEHGLGERAADVDAPERAEGGGTAGDGRS